MAIDRRGRECLDGRGTVIIAHASTYRADDGGFSVRACSIREVQRLFSRPASQAVSEEPLQICDQCIVASSCTL
jgi:hypothetical protein